jgi:hypothetical protein
MQNLVYNMRRLFDPMYAAPFCSYDGQGVEAIQIGQIRANWPAQSSRIAPGKLLNCHSKLHVNKLRVAKCCARCLRFKVASSHIAG